MFIFLSKIDTVFRLKGNILNMTILDLGYVNINSKTNSYFINYNIRLFKLVIMVKF